MQSDDEAPLTLSKWPFYLGDILLVLTALAIALLGKWQLTDLQVVSCVLAVALGAAIFVLPYIVEHSMRVREVSDDRDAEIRMLKGYLQKAESALGHYHERLQELESGSGSVDQRCELLASAVDQKLLVESERLTALSQQLAAIEASKAEQPEALAALKTELEAQFIALQEQAKEPEQPSEALLALQTAQAALEARSAQTQESLASIETFKTEQVEALAALNAKLAESAEPLAALEARVAAVEANAASTETEDARPARVARKRRVNSDSGLLHRAIQVKSDSAASAVSRIIDSKTKFAEPEAGPAVEADAKEAPVVEELVVELDPVVASTGMEGIPEDFEVSLGADLIEDDELLAAEARAESEKGQKGETGESESSVEPKLEIEAEKPTEAKPSKPAPEAKAEAQDLFEAVESAPARRVRTKADDTILSVSILIGIGNKPFLRGSGGGLSWESGIPMEFEEIGKWRWVAPVDLEVPVELQVFRNDEDADRKGRYTLNPGQQLEVSPVF
jgi:hypothetical protein